MRFTTPLRPDRWYTVTVPLNAYDAVLPAGHVLGLVLGQSDPEFTETDDRDATVRVDLGRSELILPVTGRAGLPTVDVAPSVVTAPPTRRPSGRPGTPAGALTAVSRDQEMARTVPARPQAGRDRVFIVRIRPVRRVFTALFEAP
ncbi:CocE/NonD family hydrolase C-terminal non-catalytic domain-containing protein [Micromonospora sp. M12]